MRDAARFSLVVLVLIFCFPSRAAVELGLFVDTYYAFDAARPANRERAFTTLPTRHNELAVNLVYVEGKLTADRVRGRLALQAGTSVLANYAGEVRDPAKTGVQLADVLMFLQEAYAGYRVADGLWIDGGIFFSHIGQESFVSKNNWTYTRSLIADFSPYYQAGIRAVYEPSPQWAFQLHLLQGWQNVIENNDDKAVGTQVAWHPTERLAVIHNAFVGREAELRIFQDLIVSYRLSASWESGLSLDLGFQKRRGQSSFASWYGTAWLNRFALAEGTHLGARLEAYFDREGVIVPTGTSGNFQAWGASVNFDRQLAPPLLWRTELRYLRARDAVFPSRAGRSEETLFGITSLALSL